MYEYKFSDGEKVETSSEQLKDKIKKIDKKYSFNLDYDSTKDDISLNLQKKQLPQIDDKSIEESAKQSLSSYEDQQKKAIESNYNKGLDKVKQNEDKSNSTFLEEYDKVENNYLNDKENVKNTLLKRGLAHSSILENSLSNLESKKENDIENLKTDLNTALDKLNLEKQLLETEKQSALESFNIAYAVKLSEKIDKLTQQALSKQEEIIKYNNQLEEKEKQFLVNQQKFNITQENQKLKENEFVLDYIDKYGTVGLERQRDAEKLYAAKQSLQGLTKEEAMIEIESNNYHDILGDSVYKSLIAYVSGL